MLSCERKRFDSSYDPDNKPGPPQLISPQDGEVCDLNPPIFEWEKKNEATMYNLQIDTSINFPDTSYPFSYLIYDSTTLNIDQLMDFGYFQNRNYFCRIRCSPAELDPPAWTEWSKANSFTVKIPLVASCSLGFGPHYPYAKTDGDTAYFSTSNGEIRVIKLYEPEELLSFTTNYEEFRITDIKNKILYGYFYDYAGSSIVVVLFDVKDLEAIKFISEFSFEYEYGTNYIEFSFDDNRLAVLKYFPYSSETDTIFLFDTSNYPQIDSSILIPGYQCYDIKVFDNAAYIFAKTEYGYKKIHIMDIYNIANPQEVYTLKFYSSIDILACNDNFLYLKEGNSIYVFNITNPLYPVYTGTLNINGYVKDISNTILLTKETLNDNSYYTFYQLSQGFPSSELGKILEYYPYYILGRKYFGLLKNKKIRIFRTIQQDG